MKKLLSIIIAAAMIVSCFGFFPAETFAAEKEKQNSARYLIEPDKEQAEYKEGEALAVFRSSGVSARSAAADAIEEIDGYTIESVWSFETEAEDDSKLKRLKGANDFVNIALVRSSTKTTQQLIKELEAIKSVEFAEPNYKIKAASNDTYFGKQWNLKNTGQNGGTAGESTNVEVKWDKGIKGSPEKVVAIVDTGVYYMHEELRDKMWENTFQPDLRGDYGFDFVNGDIDPLDDNGHGTHCAGIIAAAGDNGTGISGISPDTKIMALKILDAEGEGWMSDEVSAYHYIHKAMNLGVNVVAVNNSWGGGEGSEIFTELVDAVGQKGAVTVCAAGNEANNNDEYEDYPLNVESPYLVSVAASNENNELANFSNYGETTVDLAAPGADILSTVSYPSYNPSIYDDDKQNEVSAKFADFDGEETWDVISEITPSREDLDYSVELTDDHNFGETSGKSLKVLFRNVKAEETVYIKIPYELTDDYDVMNTSQLISVMAKAKAPTDASELFWDESAFIMLEQKRDAEKYDFYDSDNEYVFGKYIAGEDNYWNHFEMYAGSLEEKPAKERELLLGIYAETKGDYEIYLDDLGISKTVTDESVFGMYDYYNGTSMAAPHVTAAVALAAAEYPEADASMLIDVVMTHVREDDDLRGKVISEGVLDFSSSRELAPRIAGAQVDVAKDEITVIGGGFTNVSSVKIDGTEAEIVSRESSKIIIKNNDWINRTVDITVEGGSETVTKKDIYLVKGKAEYISLDEYFYFPSSEGILSSGVKKMYAADSSTDTIFVADPADGKDMEFIERFEVDADKYFKKDENSKASYDFTFGKDLPFADGKLYNIVAYSEVGVSEESMEDFWSQDYMDDLLEELFDELDTPVSAFSSQYKLMSFDVNTGKITDLGNLDPAVKKIEDWTLASYNGKLYMMGGYDYSTKDLSTKVMVYDPAKKKWSEGPALPEGRAEGKAVQSGDSLVYTLGYGSSQKDVDLEEQQCPVNLIFRNGKWTESKVQLEPYRADNIVTRNGVDYYKYNASVNICKEGVLYAGMAAAGVGDTFTYDPAGDKFASTKYNFGETSDRFTGVMVGKTLYGYDLYESAYKAELTNGQVKVSPAKKYSWGKITGVNTNCLPGTKITVKAVPNKGYYVKAFYIDGKKVNGTSKTFRITKNQTAKAEFAKITTKIKLNKTNVTLKDGRKFTIKPTITPSSAKKKGVTYKSSNTVYATVSSKGVVKAKKAGIGKTVTITVTAKDGTNVKAKCKVKIVD